MHPLCPFLPPSLTVTVSVFVSVIVSVSVSVTVSASFSVSMPQCPAGSGASAERRGTTAISRRLLHRQKSGTLSSLFSCFPVSVCSVYLCLCRYLPVCVVRLCECVLIPQAALTGPTLELSLHQSLLPNILERVARELEGIPFFSPLYLFLHLCLFLRSYHAAVEDDDETHPRRLFMQTVLSSVRHATRRIVVPAPVGQRLAAVFSKLASTLSLSDFDFQEVGVA